MRRELNQAAGIVEEYLRLLMVPDPAAARQFCAPDLEIRFTGNRLMREPAECAAFNAGRYKWVKKKFGPTHVAEGGTPFEGNRYVDRYVVRREKIVKMEVWNDSAEWLLVRAGLAKP